MRLQKYLADRGIASRRKCEEYITDSLVKVNGKTVTEMGIQVTEEDEIEFNSKKISKSQEEPIYLMLYKPRGYETTLARNKGKTVADLITNHKERLFYAGRLDKASEGMLIMTNDGEMVEKLTHPRHDHEKEYEVIIHGGVREKILTQLRKGILIDGRKTKPCKIEKINNSRKEGYTLLRFVLTEGRNRQIRKMCEAIGLEVKRLKRVRIGNLAMQDLKPGDSKKLNEKEIKKLLE